jgi:pimeloyl-ACP methyl ester carboxylesterase
VVRTPAGWARVRQTVGVGVLTAKLPFPRGVTPISSRVIRAVALGPDASPATIAFCQDLFYEARPDVRAACGATMSRMDLHEAVARLDVPTVVVAGERDLITPPVHAKRIAATLPQLAAYVEVPGAGHMAVLEVPDAVTSAIAAVAVRPAETLRTS